MEVLDIIAQDAKRSGKRPADVLTGVMIALDRRNAKLLHDNKSVAIIEPLDEGRTEYEVHLFTVDNPMSLVRSVKNLGSQIRSVPKLERVYGKANPEVIKMLKVAGFPVAQSDKKEFNWMAKA